MGERVATIEATLVAIQRDVDDKHRQNRASIHDLRNLQQNADDKLDSMNGILLQVRGMLRLLGGMVGMATFVWMVLQIKGALSR